MLGDLRTDVLIIGSVTEIVVDLLADVMAALDFALRSLLEVSKILC